MVTSPPYWGLRDYGTGDAQIGLEEKPDCLGWATGKSCGACYVCNMVEVFAEVRRVLRDDGTLWLNLGDTYASGGANRTGQGASTLTGGRENNDKSTIGRINSGLLSGNLVGIPWHAALALQADGWVLRNDIIWYAPNKMPESVTNRCSKSHEHIFLLAKGSDYYYDAVAIQEESKTAGKPGGFTTGPADAIGRKYSGSQLPENQNKPRGAEANKRDVWKVDEEELEQFRQWRAEQPNPKQDVWSVATQGYPGAHFATFSPRLITPCILAGTSEHGACARCGCPWERVVTKTSSSQPEQTPHGNTRKDRDRSFPSQRNGLSGSGSTLDTAIPSRNTVGWRKVCGCHTDEVVPCVVLDPFVGSGTTVATAVYHGRAGVGIDLSEKYLRDCAIPRVEAVLQGQRPERRTVAVRPGARLPARRIRG